MKKPLLVVLFAAVFALALTACGTAQPSGDDGGSGTSSGGGTSTSTGTGTGTGTDQDPKDAYVAAGYIDQHGFITVKALTELDGQGVADVLAAASYEWVDEKCAWKRVGSNLTPSRGLTSEQMQQSIADGTTDAFRFSSSEIAAFPKGSSGVPVDWFLSNRVVKYGSPAELLADQQVNVIDQCEIENGAYGIEIWAVIENSSHERFLLEVRHYASDDSGVIEVYNAAYIATNTNSIASAFNDYHPGLEDATTIDAVWRILAGRSIG